MQHTTKMVMVPQDVYSGLLTKEQQTFSPIVGQLANLDQELQKIMSDPSLSTDAKYQLYQQTFSRYQHLKHQQFPTAPAPVISQPVQTQTNPQIPKDAILDSLPKPSRRKGKILIDHLNRQSNAIQWLPSGELKLSGNVIPGSNITDLVHYVTRKRPTAQPPVGSDSFMQLLAETNVPREAISEAEEKFITPGTLGTHFSPFDASTPKKIQFSLKKSTKSSRVKSYSATPKKLTRKRKQPSRYGTWTED